jgi:hypothetical protein
MGEIPVWLYFFLPQSQKIGKHMPKNGKDDTFPD